MLRAAGVEAGERLRLGRLDAAGGGGCDPQQRQGADQRAEAPAARRSALPLLAGLLALAGCSPAANLRPMTPLPPTARAEVGVGYTAVGPRPLQDDGWAHGGQAWGTLSATTWLDVSVVGAFDDQSGTAGVAVRWRAFDHERVALGVGVELGVGWAGLQLPIAARLLDGVWVYSAPQIGTWGIDPTVRVPVGIDVEVLDTFRVRTEAQLNYPNFDPYLRRTQLGVGLGWLL